MPIARASRASTSSGRRPSSPRCSTRRLLAWWRATTMSARAATGTTRTATARAKRASSTSSRRPRTRPTARRCAPLGASCSAPAASGCHRPPIARYCAAGTAWRSADLPRPGGSWASPAMSPPPSAPPTSSLRTCATATATCCEPIPPAAPSSRRRSTTTPSWPRGCSSSPVRPTSLATSRRCASS